MTVRQISVFLENKQGRLLSLTQCLQDHKINIRALSVADTADFGIVRMIVDQPDQAYEALKQAGFTASFTTVIAVEVPDEPGGLCKVLRILADCKSNVEYIYAFCDSEKDKAINVLRMDNQEEGMQALAAAGINVLCDGEIYTI